MEELRKFTQRYKDHEELKELVQSKLKSLWKNEAIAATKIKDLFSSSPESGTANGKDQSSTNLPVSLKLKLLNVLMINSDDRNSLLSVLMKSVVLIN